MSMLKGQPPVNPTAYTPQGYYPGQAYGPRTPVSASAAVSQGYYEAQYAVTSQQALAAQLAYTTPTSQWNSGNYGQPVGQAPMGWSLQDVRDSHPEDRIEEAMRAWGCEHAIEIYRSPMAFVTIVRHDQLAEMQVGDQELYYNEDSPAGVVAWLQSVCDGGDEFWNWHEAYGVWENWRE